MPEIITPASDGEFPTPGTPVAAVHEQTVDDQGFPVADVEFPMPGTETVYYDDAAKARAEAAAKTVTPADVETKVVTKAETKVAKAGRK